jgi:hypothetical protein
MNGCNIIKVTLHVGGRHSTEFWRDGAIEKIDCKVTPACEASPSPHDLSTAPAGCRTTKEA